MEYTWDPAKARANRQKHGVEFADVVGVFEDAFAFTIRDPYPYEERFATVGRDFLDRISVVVWTSDGAAIRLIMARVATPKERRRYTEDLND